MTVPDALLTQEEVAAWLRVKPSTLKTWRTRGGGPPAVTIGRCVRYERTAVEAWLKARTEDRTPVPTPTRAPARKAVGECRPARRPSPAPGVPARLEVVR